MEHLMRIELIPSTWKADMQPMTPKMLISSVFLSLFHIFQVYEILYYMVFPAGFEPASPP